MGAGTVQVCDVGFQWGVDSGRGIWHPSAVCVTGHGVGQTERAATQDLWVYVATFVGCTNT